MILCFTKEKGQAVACPYGWVCVIIGRLLGNFATLVGERVHAYNASLAEDGL